MKQSGRNTSIIGLIERNQLPFNILLNIQVLAHHMNGRHRYGDHDIDTEHNF